MTCFCIITVCHFTQHALGIVVIPIYSCEIAGGIRAYYCIARSSLEISYLHNLHNLRTFFYCKLTRALYNTLLEVFILHE